MASPADSFVWPPFDPSRSKLGRVDQGIDVSSQAPFTAVANGRVVAIDPNFYNGTPAVYVKLDTPVRVNGRTYKAVYYSETRALVSVGQHVSAGTPITGPGNGEIGFASQFGPAWLPSAHNVYHEGARTQAGRDFLGVTQAAVYTSGGGPEHTPGVTKTVTGKGGTVSSAGPGDLSTLDRILAILGELGTARFWLRALEIVGGFLILLLGLYLLAKQAGLGDVPAPATPGLSDEARSELQFSPGRAAYSGPRRKAPVRHEVSEAADRRAAIRKRTERGGQSDDIPF